VSVIKKRIAIVTLDHAASLFYESQIKELFGELVSTSTYSALDGSIKYLGDADIYVVTTDAFNSILDYQKYLPSNIPKVEIAVNYKKETIDTLMRIPSGSDALFVNLSEKMVREAITRLTQLGVNHINFIPYFPGSPLVKQCDLAVTVGESRYVPDNVTNVIDLGQRVLDTTTIVEIALRLKLDHLLESEEFKEYFKSIASSNYSFDQIFDRSIQMESQFEILMEIIDDGIIGVTSKDVVFACNSKSVEITGISKEQAIDVQAELSYPFLPFAECRLTRKKIVNRLVKFKGVDISATVAPIMRGNEYLGAFATIQKFSEEESKQQSFRIQLLNKGHKAKYNFDDIIGESPAIKRACAIASKMASNNSGVLITGESGTGKELFAHAIHNLSERRDFPFIAINCAAVPDNLLESELFGYEEGSFTGAKRGGKLGLFEFAHKGTIFLDEVEGMSPALQIKLLRVIQEREIMHVGGDKIIIVDVRIIAASNETLEELVNQGTFRSDLYYRLSTLPINIPPLRERGDDIMILFEHIKKKLGGKFILSPQVKNAFVSHYWRGNVRELYNYVEYLTYLGKEYIDYDDLPTSFHSGLAKARSKKDEKLSLDVNLLKQLAGNKIDDYIFVLDLLHAAYVKQTPVGRHSISESAQNKGSYLTQQEVRNILNDLSTLGLVKISQGRGGSKINEQGIKVVNELKNVCN
jgi:transcriptional regulator with PAS, ATPase and Fis domain